MYIQLYNNRIVRVSDEQILEDDIQLDLPEDFDWEHIDRYEITDGDLVKHELESEITEPTAQDDTDAMMVDHEYRLVMLELGITGEV